MKENLVTIENLNNVSNINVKPSAYKSEKDLIKDILNKESVEHRRNPEKYAEKPDDELSFEQRRKKRMNDPKRGINSPAFKKFMADRGM